MDAKTRREEMEQEAADNPLPPGRIRALLADLSTLGERFRARLRRRPQQSFQSAVPRVAARTAERLSLDVPATLRGEPLPPDVFGKTAGLLPVFAWHADRLGRTAMNQGSSVYFEPEENSLTGYRCAFPMPPAFASAALLFLQESIHDAWENLPRDDMDRVMMDEIVDLFIAAQNNPAFSLRPTHDNPSA